MNGTAEFVSSNGLIYPVTQVNGQKVVGPPLMPPGMEIPEPRLDTNEVYVGNLPRHMQETELLPMFEQCGLIYKFRLIMCFSGNNRGFAYIVFFSAESAQMCLKVFHKSIFMGKTLYAHPSSNKRVLVMGNALVDKSVVETFAKFETQCTEVDVLKSEEGDLYYKLVYPTHFAAAKARRVFMRCLEMFGKKCFVCWYNTF